MTLDQLLTRATAEYVQRPNTKGQVKWTVRGRTVYLADYAGGGHIGRYDVTALRDGRIKMTWVDDDRDHDPVVVDRTVDAVLAQLDDIQLRDLY